MSTTNLTANDQRLPWVLASMTVVALLLIYYPTTQSTVSIWVRSDTFAHGFLVVPIAIWLIWRMRSDLLSYSPQSNGFGLVGLALLSLAWWVAYSVDVLVIQQLALFAMIPFAVFSILGWTVTKKISFPLFFLIFAVPMGEGLVPGLIEFTADFTVAMVKMTGIPIYREGNYFELPTGNWSVVEACSGVRYLIASVTLGFLYAYLTYKTLWKRSLFVLVSVVVPILANGMRAFMIVMIGHFSDMQLATGVDHLIYGWIFFGIVIAIMFYVGSFWREDDHVVAQEKSYSSDQTKTVKPNNGWVVFSAVLIVVSLAPARAYLSATDTKSKADIQLKTIDVASWQLVDKSLTTWRPNFVGTDAVLEGVYSNGGDNVLLYVGYYAFQRQDAELITTANGLVAPDEKEWRTIARGSVNMQWSGNEISVPLTVVKRGSENYLALHFYLVDNVPTINPYWAKFYEARARMFSGNTAASVIVVATPIEEVNAQSEAVLKRFIETAQTSLVNELQRASDSSSAR